MKRIDRYLIWGIFRATLMVLTVIAVLSFVLTSMDEAGDVGKGEYRVRDALLVVATMMPRFLVEAFPVSGLIGTLLVLGGMAASRELVALQAAGMSPRQLMGTVFKAGLLLLLLLFLLGDLIGPRLELWGQEYRLQRMNKQVTFHSRYGFWVKDGNAFVNIRNATSGGRLEGVSIYELDSQQRLQRVTLAAGGVFSEGRWLLRDVRQSTLEGRRIRTEVLPELDWKTVVDPAMLSVALIRPRLQSTFELWRQLRALRAAGQRAMDYALAFWNKVATVVTLFALMLLAVPLVTGSHQRVNVGHHLFLGALLGAGFYLASKGFYYTALVFDLPPVSVALFPLAAMFFLLLLLARLGRL